MYASMFGKLPAAFALASEIVMAERIYSPLTGYVGQMAS